MSLLVALKGCLKPPVPKGSLSIEKSTVDGVFDHDISLKLKAKI